MKIPFNISNNVIIQSEFVDRETERNDFWKKYQKLCEREDEWTVTVFNYFGMGGVGKSTLLNKLMLEAKEQTKEMKDNIPVIFVSMIEKDNYMQVMNRAIRLLKQYYNFEFPLYEIAMVQLAKVSGSHMIKNEVKALEESSDFLSGLLEGAAIEPNAAIAVSVFRILDKLAKIVRTHIEKNKSMIQELGGMRAEEIIRQLPDFFADDLRMNSVNQLYPVIFILDKLEIFRKNIIGNDEIDWELQWLRTIVRKVPNVVWVCSSREKLPWEGEEWADSLYDVEIKAFDEEWTGVFFEKNKMSVEHIERDLYELTKGVPVYLDICHEIYERCYNSDTEITIDSFGGKQEHLLQTYVENLSETEMQVLFVLACLGDWDEQLINYIAENIKIERFQEAYNILLRKSYILSMDQEHELHQVIQKQIFMFCQYNIMQNTVALLWEYMNKNPHLEDWIYLKCLRIDMRCIKTTDGLKDWWESEKSIILKNYMMQHNINWVEKCYGVIMEELSESLRMCDAFIFISAIHVQNVILLHYYHTAMKDINYLLRLLRDRSCSGEVSHREISCHLLELKAQALDGLGKHSIAFQIRKKMCDEDGISLNQNAMKRRHNLALSYSYIGKTEFALEIMDTVIKYRETFCDEQGEDLIKALTAKTNMYLDIYKHDISKIEYIERALDLAIDTIKKSVDLFGEDDMCTIHAKLTYASILMDTYAWKPAKEVLLDAYCRLIQINKGRNAYTDYVLYQIEIVSMELGEFELASIILDQIKESSMNYEENNELYDLRCKLEESIRLSRQGEHENARNVVEAAYVKGKDIYGENASIVLKLQYQMAVEWFNLKQYSKALDILEKVYKKARMHEAYNDEFIWKIKNLHLMCKKDWAEQEQ